MKEDLANLSESRKEIQDKVDSVPGEIIDPVITEQKIEAKRALILSAISEKKNATNELRNSEKNFEKVNDFLIQFDISSYQEKKELIDKNKEKLSDLLNEMRRQSEIKDVNHRKQELLTEVPCGSQYPSCKFIKDAHAAAELIQISVVKLSDLSSDINSVGHKIKNLNPVFIENHIDKYNLLVDKKNVLATSVASSSLQIERSDALVFREQVELEQLESKNAEYEENKEAIENLKGLIMERNKIDEVAKRKEKNLEVCESDLMELHKNHGSWEQKLLQVEEMSQEYEILKEDFGGISFIHGLLSS